MVMAIRVISFGPAGILVGTAADRVDADEQDEDDDEEDGELVPVSADSLQHPGLARVALVA